MLELACNTCAYVYFFYFYACAVSKPQRRGPGVNKIINSQESVIDINKAPKAGNYIAFRFPHNFNSNNLTYCLILQQRNQEPEV